LTPHYKRADDEIRMLVKAIMRQTVDIEPDYQNNMLYITLYPLANNRSNRAVEKVIETINDTKTIFPGSKLMLNFKIATS
ncbi:MAG: hypothetical protein LBC98_03410, partial [Prevotellaceae bacterium]|jgi:hypothetical protein|nr:hypothetical protein [Prevotellaceae bacterium]